MAAMRSVRPTTSLQALRWSPSSRHLGMKWTLMIIWCAVYVIRDSINLHYFVRKQFEIVSHDIPINYIILYYVILLYYIILCFIKLNYIISYYIIYYFILFYIMLYHFILYYIIFYSIISFYIILFYIIS